MEGAVHLRGDASAAEKAAAEVALELEELISDMLEDGGTIEEVLVRLGDPAAFAKKYQDGARCLIGPAYFDNYIWLLRIVLICTAAGSFAAGMIEAVRSGVEQESVVQAVMVTVARGLPGGLLKCGCGMPECFRRRHADFCNSGTAEHKFERPRRAAVAIPRIWPVKTDAWTPAALELLPHKKAVISRGDNVVGIVFILIFGMLLIFAPGLFSAMHWENGVLEAVPLFNFEQWNRILPVFVLSLAVGLVDEIVQLIAGRYCKAVLFSSVACGAVQLLLSYIVLKVFPLWNPNFAGDVQTMYGAGAWWAELWNGDMVSNVLFGFLVLVTLIEVGTTLYKTLRYGDAPSNQHRVTQQENQIRNQNSKPPAEQFRGRFFKAERPMHELLTGACVDFFLQLV